jgi:hypothetical protein
MSEWVYLINEWEFINLAYVKSVRYDDTGKFQVKDESGFWQDALPDIYSTPFKFRHNLR